MIEAGIVLIVAGAFVVCSAKALYFYSWKDTVPGWVTLIVGVLLLIFGAMNK